MRKKTSPRNNTLMVLREAILREARQLELLRASGKRTK